MSGKVFAAAGVAIALGLGLTFMGKQLHPGPDFKQWEKKVGFHLYVPTHLPRGLKPDRSGIKVGAHRVMWNYVSGDITLNVAEEKRTRERDGYHQRVFFARGTKTRVDGREAVFSKDTMGGRRLFWNMEDVAIVIRSGQLSDDELLEIARSMK